jgi:cytoskeleton protein RodZ
MPQTGPTSIGATLHAERLRLGKDLAKIAAETKICATILEALENDRFDSLPGGAYRRSFLRQYARALGVNEEETLAAFRQQYQETPVALPAPPKPRPIPYVRGAASLLLAASAIAGFYKIAENGSPERKYSAIELLPRRAAHPQPETAPKASQPQSEAAANRVLESSPSAPVRAVLTVTEPVWVSVSCDGKQSYTGTLVETESKSFEASVSVTVLIGNAGGLTINLNGRPVGPIGAHGETQLLELTSKGARRLPRGSSLPINGAPGPTA